MQRATVMLPDDRIRRLRRIAAERRTSMAALSREAAEAPAQRYRPQRVGIGDSSIHPGGCAER